MASKIYTLQQLEDSILKNTSWRATAFDLGLNGDGGSNTKTLRKLPIRNNFDYSHYLGRGSNKNTKPWNHVPVEKYLKKGIIVKSGRLKVKLIEAGLIEDKCSKCGLGTVWNNEPIVLELDHIDGDKSNNLLENLRVICPNCHSQTPTFRGRNKKAQVGQLAESHGLEP